MLGQTTVPAQLVLHMHRTDYVYVLEVDLNIKVTADSPSELGKLHTYGLAVHQIYLSHVTCKYLSSYSRDGHAYIL